VQSVRTLFVAALALLALVLPSAGVRAQPAAVEISAILPLTGGNSFTNVQIRASMLVAQDIVNKTGGIRGRPLHFTFFDDTGNPATAVSLAAQVVASHPAVLMGPTLVSTCRATEQITLKGPVEWCFSPGVPIVPDGYMFASLVSTHENLQTTMRFLRDRGVKRIGLLLSTDATGQDGEEQIDYALALPENKGLSVVAVEKFNTNDISVAAQVSRIKAAAPDAVVAWTTGASLETNLRGLNEAGLDVPVITTPGNMTHAQMTAMAKIIPKAGLYFPSTLVQAHGILRPGPIRDAQDRYFAAMHDAHVVPEPGGSYGWDPTLIIVQALRTLGPDATAAQIHDYLEQLHGFAGINGIYDFRDGQQHGLTRTAGVVARWFADKNDWIAVTRPGGGTL
jgi:branched-chain amino acid transport system substrate-binding protein